MEISAKSSEMGMALGRFQAIALGRALRLAAALGSILGRCLPDSISLGDDLPDLCYEFVCFFGVRIHS